jgi:hypothetical protein
MTSDAKLTQSPAGMSDTPRTDALEAGFAGWDKLRWIPHVVVQKSLAHARELERECKRLDDAINRACDRITDLQRQRPVEGITMKFETHCPGGQMCGATTTGCLEGKCQRKEAERCSCASFSLIPCPVHGNRDPRQSQPKCHSCGGWVKLEEGGICLPCHTE